MRRRGRYLEFQYNDSTVGLTLLEFELFAGAGCEPCGRVAEGLLSASQVKFTLPEIASFELPKMVIPTQYLQMQSFQKRFINIPELSYKIYDRQQNKGKENLLGICGNSI